MARVLAVLALVFLAAGCEARTEPVAVLAPDGVRASMLPSCSPDEGATPDGRCLPIDQAYVGTGGTTYWVDQHHDSVDYEPDGSRDRPWRTITHALRALRPGDAVVVRAGIYEEALKPRIGGTGPDARITIAAYPGDTVYITGAEWLHDVHYEGLDAVFSWTGDGLPPYSENAEAVFRRELVGTGQGEGLRVYRPVANRAALRPGTFTVEGAVERPSRLVVRAHEQDPERPALVWIARPAQLFAPRGQDPYLECGDPATPGWFRLIGLTFRVASNYAQEGAVCAGSRGSRLEQVTVEWTNGRGIDMSGQGHVFIDVRANFHGQLGMGGSCSECLFEGGELIGNNWKGYDPLWEAGGAKWVRAQNTVIRGMSVRDNDGPGLWLDIDNRRYTLEDNLVENNAVAGIMLEFDTVETLVQHNTVRGTRFAGYSGAGILSQAASHNLLLHNTLLDNEGIGVWLRRDPDRRAPDGDTGVFNSVLAGNGWTETEEGREIAIEANDLGDSHGFRLDGNLYGRHAHNDWRTSTFFFVPDPDEEGGLRNADLQRWQYVVGGDRTSQLVDPDGWRDARRSAASAPLPPSWAEWGALTAPPRLASRPGASPYP